MNGHREKGSGFGHCMGRAAALLFYKAKPISGLFCEVPKSNRLSFCETKPTSHLLSGKLHPFCVDSSAEPQPGGCRRGEQGKYGVNGQETSGSPASSTVPPAPRRDTCRARQSGCPALPLSAFPTPESRRFW